MNKRTLFFDKPVYIMDTATVVGPKEAEGPLSKYFDKKVEDDLLGQKSYEAAEVKFHLSALKYLLNKTSLKDDDIDAVFCGDLEDEIVASSFTMRELDIAFMGIYNACATFGESLIFGASMIASGFMEKIICSTSSHFSSAERQYRFPLELGNQRTPLSQWTATGVGAALLNSRFGKVRIDCATIGKVVDYGVSDINNMGGAMAPAARDTFLQHLAGTGRTPEYYDLIVTGDLGDGGSQLFKSLVEESGIKLDERVTDCGVLLFNRVDQKVEQGGSGAACNSMVFCSYIYKKMMEGEFKRVLLMPTGALISKTSGLQGETIPGICHAVSFTRE